MAFSRALALLIASNGIETSISFLRICSVIARHIRPIHALRIELVVAATAEEVPDDHAGTVPMEARSATLNATAVSAKPSSR